MAIVVTNPNVVNWGFFLSATSVDVSDCEVLMASPGAGKSICVDFLMVNSTDAIAISLGAGEAGGNLVAPLIGPIEFTAKQTLQWTFGCGGLKVATDTLFAIDSDGAGVIYVFCSGHVR